MNNLIKMLSMGVIGRKRGGAALAHLYGITDFENHVVGSYNNKERGWEFKVGDSPITVTGLRIFSYLTESKRVNLWNTSGTLLGYAIIPDATHEEWVEGQLSASVVLSANTNYIVSAYAKEQSFHEIADAEQNATTGEHISYVTGRFRNVSNEPNQPTTRTSAGWIHCIVDILYQV